MQVFLCWSGASSHKIALALHGFLGDVIQDLKPFLSSETIRKGQRWELEIGKRLSDTNYGIVCLTKDNLTAPWILFESGALAKNLTEGRVTALLAGIQSTDVINPLSQFQHARADRSEIFKLLNDLNELLPAERRLEADRLARAFDIFWPPFEKRLIEALASAGTPKSRAAPPRDAQDMVSELLELVREMKREDSAASERAIDDLQSRLEHVKAQSLALATQLEKERMLYVNSEHAALVMKAEIEHLKAQLKKKSR